MYAKDNHYNVIYKSYYNKYNIIFDILTLPASKFRRLCVKLIFYSTISKIKQIT
jgi:hypothetical protein